MKKSRIPKWAQLQPPIDGPLDSLGDLQERLRSLSRLKRGYLNSGVCEHCDAYVWPDEDDQGFIRITIFHDDGCPVVN